MLIVLYELSQLLNTQLDKETLATCVGMIESGVNPEALAVSIVVSTMHGLRNLQREKTLILFLFRSGRCFGAQKGECGTAAGPSGAVRSASD